MPSEPHNLGFENIELWDGPSDKGEYERRFTVDARTEMKAGRAYRFAVEALETSEFVGGASLRLPYYADSADIGYWIGIPHWNRGYASEAIGLLCYFAFNVLGAVRVSSTVFDGNQGSLRVLEKNGFSVDGKLRRDVFKYDKWYDTLFLTLLAEEWQACRREPVSILLEPVNRSKIQEKPRTD